MNFIIFDGHCSKCNRFASFIDKRASKSQLNLHPLESEKGKFLLKQYGFPEEYQDSVVLIKENKPYINSTAILYCIILLNKWWKLAYIGFLVPICIRDYVYQQIAKRRKKKVCKI